MQLSAHKKGLTLVELLVVTTIIAVLVTPLLLTYRTYRTSQALNSSVESVANHTRSAHIFAREARSQREWGIKSTSATTYAIFSTGASGEVIEQRYALDNRVQFQDDFTILFLIGTGATDGDYIIELVTDNGSVALINVSQLGVVEVERL